MNNDIQIARFIASGSMSREVALQESEAVRLAQAAKREEAKEKQDKRRQIAKDAAAKRQEDQKNTQQELQDKLKSRRQNLVKKQKEAVKLRKQNPTLGDRVAKYKPKYSGMTRISSQDGSVTNTSKFIGNVAKMGANVAKGAVGAVAGAQRLGKRIEGGKARDRAATKVKAAERMVAKAEGESIRSKTKSAKPSQFAAPKPPQAKTKVKSSEQKKLAPSKESLGSKARKDPELRKKLMQQREEFLHEVDKKMPDEKLEKIIDIMKGKNKIKINPDVKENTVMVKDANGEDFVEIVDLIKPEPLKSSNWRKDFKVENS